MSGRDVSTRQKSLSVAFSVIMVLSMVAVGIAGFAGSAAALQDPAEPDGFANVVVPNQPAEPGQSGVNLTATTVISQGSSLDTNNLEKVNITFDTALSANNLAAGDVRVEVIEPGGGSAGSVAADAGGVTETLDTTTIEISAIESGGGSGITVNSGDKVRIITKSNNVDLPDQEDIGVSIGVEDNSNNDNVTSTTLELPGPVSVDGTSFSTIQSGLNNATSGEQINVGAGQFDGNGSTIDITTPNLIINGSSGAQIVSDAETNDGQLQINANNVTVDNLEFQGSLIQGRNEPANAIQDNGNPINTTVSNSQFGNFSKNDVVNLAPGDGSPGITTVNDNTFTDIDAIPINIDTTNTDVSDGDDVEITSNTITLSSGSNDLIQVDDSGDSGTDATVSLTDNTLDGPGSSGVGIDLGETHALGSGTVDIDGGSIANVSTGISAGVDGSDLNITNVGISSVGTNAIASSNGVADLRVDSVTVDNAGTDGIDISTTGPSNLLEVTGSTINASSTAGIDLNELGGQAVVSSTDITNSGGIGVNIANPSGDVTVNESSLIDQATTGISVDVQSTDSVDINNVEINGTTTSGVDLANINNADGTFVNVTDSTFTNNDPAALNYSSTTAITSDPGLNVHFNTFENNAVGIGFDDSSGAYDSTFNATFNDFVDNDVAGLDVQSMAGSGVVNANFSYWGSTTGPNATSNVKALNAFGNGDDVSVNNAGDANVFPFLKESIDELSSSQRSGDQLVLIENPNHTQEVERGDMFVTVLDQNSGLTANQIVAEDVNGNFETLENPDGSGELGLTNAATIEHRALNSGEFDVSVRATGFGDDTTAQTITGELDSTAISANTTEIGAGETVELTVTALDEGGENVLRQGVGDVTFTETNAGGAGVNLVDNEVSVANDGELTVLVEPSASGIDSGGGDFQLDAQLGSTSPVSLNITPVAGDIDAGESTVELAGETFTEDKNGTVNETQEFSVEVQDSSSNNISGVDVTFDANASVFDGSETVTETTGDNGNVTAEFTLPTEAGAVNFNVTADSTTLEDQNVTAEAAAAQELAFDTDSRNVPLDGDANVTVVAEDKFGNANATGDDVTLSSSDSDVLNITDADNQRSLDADGAEFELNGKQPGSVTVTASVSENYSNVSDEFIVDTPAGLDVSLNRSSLSEAQSGAENVSLVEAQLTDSEGNEFGASNVDVDFAVQSPRTVEIVNDEFSDTTDSTGLATTNVTSLTDEFGTSTIEVFATEFGLQETVDITVSGQIDSYAVSVENNTALTTETVNATVQFVDSEDRVVPLNNTSISLATPSDVGSVDSSVTTNISENGVVEGEFQINADEAGSVDVRAIGQGISTITEDVVAFDSVLELNEQATDAPRFNAENDSGPAVVVESVNTDGDEAAVIVTFENGGNDTIAGLETGTFDNENVAVAVEDTGGFPGDHTAHVIPTDELSSDYAAGDNVSTETLNNVTDDATATVFNAALDFEDQSFDGSTDQVTVNTSDLQPNDTDYVIVVHPTADDGSIQSPVGNSGDLTGAQDNVTVDVDQINENNEFVAMLHFTDSEDAFGSAIPNADDEDGFVAGNVADQATITVQESQVAASVTFNDQTVTSGTEEVIIDSADFTRADGSAGDYVVVVHTIDEFGAPVGNVSPAIGASDDLTGAEQNITVDLTAADGPINSLTENVTLRAMLHTTANDSAFGTRLGNAIDGIERGDETDDANITVEDPAEFQLSGLDPTEETVQQGDEIDVSVTVTNEGDLEGTQNVTLSIGENEVDEQVTLGAGENTTVSFDNVSTSAIDAPANVTYTVSTDDADVSGNLTVERGLATYQDENGDTSIDQLRDAITDFRNDDIGIDLLRGVIDSFRESQ